MNSGKFNVHYDLYKTRHCISSGSGVKPGKNLIFLKNGKNSKIVEMV